MDSWKLVYHHLDFESSSAREALCVVGNGYLATRGVGPEVKADGIHYPGTYLAGGYNRAETEVGDHVVENEDLVNWPNWLPLAFRNSGGEWFELSAVNILSYKKEMFLYEGVLWREIEFEDHSQRRTRLEERRFVSMDEKHMAGVEWNITPLNWSGEIELLSALDGSVKNQGVARYKRLNSEHLKMKSKGVVQENIVYLETQTKQSEIVLAQTARTDVYEGSDLHSTRRETFEEEKTVGQRLFFECSKHKTYRVEKIVSFYSSKDFAISTPLLAASKASRRAGNFSRLLNKHRQKWKELWFHFDLKLENMPCENMTLRLHIFHLLQTVCHNTIDIDASAPARGLHGEAYRGHIFWDELFIFPFYYFRMPELARSLLMYRYRRLGEAKFLAKEAGHQGAMFPWQSGSDGDEESQLVHLNPKSGRWLPDNTHLQRHINGAIVYNIVKYHEATNDHEFIHYYGVEMVFEICKFWVGAAKLCSASRRYELDGMVGPDEFHTRYPGAKEPGLRNNAYTNYLASWSIKKGIKLLSLLNETKQEELLQNLELTRDDLAQWAKVSRNMFIPFHGDGVISQFSGYEELEEFDWEKYRKNSEDLHRLDRVLEAEGDDVNRYKVNKQADVVMLFYLFSADELSEHFEWLNYHYDPDVIPKTIHYYLAQSSNGSSLSRIVHSWVLARMDRTRSWNLFREALSSDLSDLQSGTTGEGIHLGAMAGTIDIVQRCFTGIEIRHDVLWFNPLLPKELSSIEFQLRYREHWLRIKLGHESLKIKVERSWISSGKIGFKDKIYEFQQGDSFDFALER